MPKEESNGVESQGTGKSSLIVTHAGKQFPTGYVPVVSVVEFITVHEFDDHSVRLSLRDTCGGVENNRPSTYIGMDIFLLCFAVDDRTSLHKILTEHNPVIERYCPNKVKILVATKTDLRSDESSIEEMQKKETSHVSTQEALAAAQKLGIKIYKECSAKELDGVENLFRTAAERARKKKGNCILL